MNKHVYSVIVSTLLLLVACSSPEISSVRPPVEQAKKPNEKAYPSTDAKNLLKPSKANTLAAYQRELAIHISQMSPSKIYVESPQAMLRAVLVVKFSIDTKGKLIRSDFVRTNHDREAENTATASLINASPFPQPPSFLLQQGKIELIETWLFNTDGRFQLRTISLPQARE